MTDSSYATTNISFPDVRQKLENPAGGVVGIEVKASSTVKSGDFKGFKYLSELLDDSFLRGIVLYTGDQPVSFGSNLYALPVSKLWRTGEVPHEMSKDKTPKVRKMGIRAKVRLLPKMSRRNAEEAASHD